MKLQKIYRERYNGMLFVDDIILVEENREEINQSNNVRSLVLEEKRLRINRSKAEYMEYEFDKREQVDESRSEMTVGRGGKGY